MTIRIAGQKQYELRAGEPVERIIRDFEQVLKNSISSRDANNKTNVTLMFEVEQ